MKKALKKDWITTVTGGAFVAAEAAAPYFPQYQAQFMVAKVVAGALFAFYAKQITPEWDKKERRK